MENIKEQLEEVIKKNLPEKMEWQGGEAELYIQIADGFNQALSQIDTSLIADEVLKVVGEKIEKEDLQSLFYKNNHTISMKESNEIKEILIQLLSNLSPNKENKNNER